MLGLWVPSFAPGPQRSGLDSCLPFHTSPSPMSPGRKGNTGQFSGKLLAQASACLLDPKGVDCDLEEDGFLEEGSGPGQGMRGSARQGCSGPWSPARQGR